MAVFESNRYTGLPAALYQLLFTGCYDDFLFEQWLATDDCTKPCEEALALCSAEVPDVMAAQELFNDAFEKWRSNFKTFCYCNHEETPENIRICSYCDRKYCVNCAESMLDVDSDDEYVCSLNCGALYK